MATRGAARSAIRPPTSPLGPYQRPRFGVYAVRGTLPGGQVLDGVANLGTRPMFDPPKELLEPYFFDFDGDLYGQTIEVELIAFLRDEAAFEDLDALKAQIARDCEQRPRGARRMTEIPTLHTRRLILRAQRPDDTEPLMAAFADDDFARFITREKRGLDRVEAWRLVSLVAGSWAAMGYGQWIAEERATGRAVGRLGPWAPEGWPDFEIGWSIFPEHQGKGYAIEGAAAAIVWAQEDAGPRPCHPPDRSRQ